MELVTVKLPTNDKHDEQSGMVGYQQSNNDEIFFK